MYRKGQAQAGLISAKSTNLASGDEVDTEFEEDFSDLEEYSGRRSEDSVGSGSLYGCTQIANQQ